ncbi:hypothetical protein [Paraburkholderia sp. DGU8]|uniref:hypothetical protein n=1 Tax=Paraburkholderia sp. DGU8 TaxID=3161997 RepID=UPI003467514F
MRRAATLALFASLVREATEAVREQDRRDDYCVEFAAQASNMLVVLEDPCLIWSIISRRLFGEARSRRFMIEMNSRSSLLRRSANASSARIVAHRSSFDISISYGIT